MGGCKKCVGGKRVPIKKQWDETFMCILGSTILGGEHELFSPPTSIGFAKELQFICTNKVVKGRRWFDPTQLIRVDISILCLFGQKQIHDQSFFTWLGTNIIPFRLSCYVKGGRGVEIQV